MKLKRKSNFELLRIVATLLIIIFHISIHSDLIFANNEITINKLFIQMVSYFGKLGVLLFMLITGYFLHDKEHISVKRVINFIGQCTFYSLAISVGLIFLGKIDLDNTKEIIKILLYSVFPLPYSVWWYATCYLMIYLFSPYFNLLIKNMTKQQHSYLIILGLVLWSIFPVFVKANLYYNEFVYMTVIYFLGAYISKYPPKKRKYGLYTFLLLIGLFLMTLAFDILGLKFDFMANHATYFRCLNSPFELLLAITVFLKFRDLSIEKEIINKISVTTFGVYLIHDNGYLRNLLWNDLFEINKYIDSPMFIIYIIMVCIIVFVFCLVIEFLRISASKRVVDIIGNMRLKIKNKR